MWMRQEIQHQHHPASAVRAGPEWTLPLVGRELARRYKASWHDTPAASRRAWMLTLLIGTVLLALLLFAVSLYGSRVIGNGPMPGEAEFAMRMIEGVGFSFSTALWIQTIGTDIPLLIVLATVGGVLAWHGKPLEALTLVLAWVLVYVVVEVGWATWDRQRPDLVGGGLAAPGFSAFPSGHTAKTFAVYGVLAYLWARTTSSMVERVGVFVIATLMAAGAGLGRLRMGAHWPSDIAGGMVLGLLMLIVLSTALERARRAAPERQTSKGIAAPLTSVAASL
jgi:undecaprenyl-diphosphatase